MVSNSSASYLCDGENHLQSENYPVVVRGTCCGDGQGHAGLLAGAVPYALSDEVPGDGASCGANRSDGLGFPRWMVVDCGRAHRPNPESRSRPRS